MVLKINIKQVLVATAFVSSIVSLSCLPTLGQNPELLTGMDVKEMRETKVKGVTVENFAGQAIIKSIGKDKKVRVSLKGPDALLKKVVVSDHYHKHDGSLYVAFEKDVPILKDLTQLTLTIEMPSNMPLNFSLVGGKADIGERDTNDTKIYLSGFGDIKVKSLKNVESRIDGSGEITILNITGEATIGIRGDGRYSIQKGSISNLKASIEGTGVIDVMADVRDADLKSEGAGSLTLATVTGKLTQSSSGAGVIKISKVEGSISNKVSGSSQLEMNCGKQLRAS